MTGQYTHYKKTAIVLEIAAVTCILTIAGIARLHGISCIGIADLLPDEARLGLSSAIILNHNIFIINFFQPAEPPLMQYIIVPFQALFGTTPWTIKLAPACFGIASVLAIYLAGRSLFSINTGLIAAGLAALLPSFIFWGGVAYGSSFVALFTALILCFHALFVQTGKKYFLWLEALACGLGFSTNLVMLYVSISFISALLISGQYKIYIKNKKSIIVAFIFFLAGASFLLLYMILSSKLPLHIIGRSNADTMVRDLHTFNTALYQRISMLQNYFDWVILLPFIYWPIAFLSKRKINNIVVFLAVFIIVFVTQSVITWSGMYLEHLTVIVPIAVVLIGSVVEISLYYVKWNYKIVPFLIMAIFIVVGFRMILNRNLPSPAYVCQPTMNADISQAFNSLTPNRTLVSTSESLLSLWYYQYTRKGILPNTNTVGITSMLCNSFKPCPVRSDTISLDTAFRLELNFEDKSSGCVDIKTTSYHFDNPVCAEIFRELILHFIGDDNRNNVLLCEGEGDSELSNHPFVLLNNALKKVLYEMERDGLIKINDDQVRGSHSVCDILHITQNMKLTSRINNSSLYEAKHR